MQTTIDTVFVNTKIIRIYIYFVNFQHETQDKYAF